MNDTTTEIVDPAMAKDPVFLPFDVSNAILQLLLNEPDENKDALLSCALTCNHFRYQVRRVQFRSITLNVQAEVRADEMIEAAQKIEDLHRLVVHDVYAPESGYSLQNVIRSFFINIRITLVQRYGEVPIPNKLEWQNRISDILSRLTRLKEFGLAAIVPSPSISMIPVPWQLFPRPFRNSIISVLQYPGLKSVYLDSVEFFPVHFIPVRTLTNLSLRQVFGSDNPKPTVPPSVTYPPETSDNRLHSLYHADRASPLYFLVDRFPSTMSSLKSLTLDLTHAQRRGFVALRYAEALPHLRSLESLLLMNKISCGHASSPDLNFILDLCWFRNLEKLSFHWTIGASSFSQSSDTPWDAMKVLKQTKGPTNIRHVTITTTFKSEDMSPLGLCRHALSVQQWVEIDRLLAGSCFSYLHTVTIIFVANIRRASTLEDEEEHQLPLNEIESKIDEDLREALYATSKLVTVFEIKVVNNRTSSSRRTTPKTGVLNDPELNDLAQHW